MKRLAIMGSAGFVGGRLLETLVLAGERNFTALVRDNRSLAKLCRFGSTVAVQSADATDENRLSPVLEGHEVVVNLVSGAAEDIWNSTRAIAGACRENGVKRLIHLSSTVVYGTLQGQPVRDDAPPLPLNQLWFPYARAKAKSELFLREQARHAGMEIAILRPGIVWGPRSPWTFGAASDLKQGAAYLIGDGRGICNGLYVDNLVSYILTVAEADGSVSGCYNVSDREELTWYDFYAALAPHCGFDMANIARIPGDRFRPSAAMRLEQVKSTAAYGWLKERFSAETRAKIKDKLRRLMTADASPLPQAAVEKRTPLVTREMWDLQRVAYKLPSDKFHARFGLEPPVTFSEGIRRSVEWLRFTGLLAELPEAGNPVRNTAVQWKGHPVVEPVDRGLATTGPRGSSGCP